MLVSTFKYVDYNCYIPTNRRRQFMTTSLCKNNQVVSEILESSYRGFIDQNYIIKKYNVSRKTAERTLKSLDLKHIKSSTLSIIADCNQGMSIDNLCEKYKCSKTNIYNILNRWQEFGLIDYRYNYDLVTNTPVLNKLHIDYSYFDCLDTPIKNYLLGYIFGDGGYDQSKSTLILSSTDYEVIDLFVKETKCEYKVRIINSDKWQPQKCVFISNRTLLSKLVGYGFGLKIHRKIDKNLIPKQYWHDFIRGYFDADGHCHYSLMKTARGLEHKYNFSITSPLVVLKTLKEMIIEGAQLNTQMYLQKTKGRNSAVLVQSGRLACKKILSWLYYDNCFCIQRKKKLI